MGRWEKKRWPSQVKDTVADTWVTSSNTQLLRVFLVSLTFEQLSYYFDIETIYNHASKHICTFFWILWKQIIWPHKLLFFMLTRLRIKNSWKGSSRHDPFHLQIWQVLHVCLVKLLGSQGWPAAMLVHKKLCSWPGFPSAWPSLGMDVHLDLMYLFIMKRFLNVMHFLAYCVRAHIAE